VIVLPAIAVLCESCGKRLARDHSDTICSPCRRTNIETSAHRGAQIVRDGAGIKTAFEEFGLYGVAERLGCTPAEALDVLLHSQLVPAVSPRRHALLVQLLALGNCSHVAAAEALHISRWTVATYRRQLGIERASSTRTTS
jgi:hypothetical protein